MNHSRLPPRALLGRRAFFLLFAPSALCALVPAFATDALAAKLQPQAAKSWETYLQWADSKAERELAQPDRFLIQEYLSPQERANAQRRLKAGEVFVQRVQGVVPQGIQFEVPDAAIHHWWGSIFIPQITLGELLPFLKDYDHHAGRFREVQESRLLSRNGENYKFYFRLKRSNPFITVHYNTEQECSYTTRGSARASSRSVATRIAELKDAGTRAEREMTPGDDHGFLWRLVSWWRFQQTPEGVTVECESASLSRRIPIVVGIIPGLRGYLESVPKDSLENTLTSVRREAIAFKNNPQSSKASAK